MDGFWSSSSMLDKPDSFGQAWLSGTLHSQKNVRGLDLEDFQFIFRSIFYAFLDFCNRNGFVSGVWNLKTKYAHVAYIVIISTIIRSSKEYCLDKS